MKIQDRIVRAVLQQNLSSGVSIKYSTNWTVLSKKIARGLSDLQTICSKHHF